MISRSAVSKAISPGSGEPGQLVNGHLQVEPSPVRRVPKHHPGLDQRTVDSTDSTPFMSIFDQPFELEGSFATSGLDLVYTTSNGSVLAVNSAGKLDPKATGNVTVTVSQPGDSHFSAATARPSP